MSRKRHGTFHAGLRLLRTDLPQGPAQDFLLPADDCRVRIAGRIGLRQCVFGNCCHITKRPRIRLASAGP